MKVKILIVARMILEMKEVNGDSDNDEGKDSSDTIIFSKRRKIVISNDYEPENLNNFSHNFERKFRFGCRADDW